jgi:hypothetical protein
LYPPVLPAIAALFQYVAGTSDFVTAGHALRLFYFTVFIAYSVATFLLLRKFLPMAFAGMGSLVCILQLNTIFMSDQFYSELPFCLVTVLFILCNLQPGLPRVFSLPLAAVAFGLRTAGIALLMAWVVEGLLQGRFKAGAVRLLACLALAGSWAGFIRHVEAGEEYKHPVYSYQRADYLYTNVSYARNMRLMDPFSPEAGHATWRDEVVRFFRNSTVMPRAVGEAVSGTEFMASLLRKRINQRTGLYLLPGWMVKLFWFALSGSIVTGFGVFMFKRHYLIALYVLFSIAVMCASPWPEQFSRYLTPLVPFLILLLLVGLCAVARLVHGAVAPESRLSPYYGFVAAVAGLILICEAGTLIKVYKNSHQPVTYMRNGKEVEYRLFFYEGRHRATEPALEFVKANAHDSDVVAATDPQWNYLLTNLKTVIPPSEIDPAKAQSLLDGVPVRFLMVDDSVYHKYTAAVIAANPERWRRVYVASTRDEPGAAGAFEIYERIKSN